MPKGKGNTNKCLVPVRKSPRGTAKPPESYLAKTSRGSVAESTSLKRDPESNPNKKYIGPVTKSPKRDTESSSPAKIPRGTLAESPAQTSGAETRTIQKAQRSVTRTPAPKRGRRKTSPSPVPSPRLDGFIWYQTYLIELYSK